MYPGFARTRMRLATLGQTGMFTGKRNSTVTVFWTQYDGDGEADPVTGAEPGIEQDWSGTMTGLVHQIGAETKLRQFTEIQTGDMMLDIDPCAAVSVMGYTTLASGTVFTSGTVCLDDLDGVRFLIDGTLFTQREIGEQLATAWNVIFGDQKLIRTILLRTAT